jgi:osmoprotectant transport system substrate-binding protein
MRRVLCSLTLAALSGCSGERVFTVASKNFTEQVILGEIVAQHLERRLGRPVSRKLNLGGTLLAHQALVAGEIDVYPEYTGTALTAVLNLPAESDPAVVFEGVAREYQSRWKLAWLPPLGFNNTFAMVMRGEEARRRKLETLSDAARSRPVFQLGAGYEFLNRPDGFPALQKTYNLPLASGIKTMDMGLLYQALAQGQVNLIAANSTDGLLSAQDLKILADDKRSFPPYQAALVLRPGDAEAGRVLGELSGKISNETMRKLNYEVDGKHRPVAEVAKEFLAGL